MRRWSVSLRSVTHMIVRGSQAKPSSDTDRPTPAHLAHWRDKIRPARAARGHFRYKILPAHPKWLDLAHFLHAGRVLYRSHHQGAEQGEFCTEREAEIERANTTHRAPLVWRAPAGPNGLAAVLVGGGRARAGLEIDHSEPQARVWRSRGRAAAHRHTQRPGPQSRTRGGRACQRGGYRSTRPLSTHSATASSRLRPNDRQSWRRRRIHRNMPPTTAAPRPAPPMRPSKPVRARRCFRLGSTAGTSGAT